MLIFLDTEYAHPGMSLEAGRPDSKEYCEIIQIAAICVDEKTGKEVSVFDKLVKPRTFKKLPSFFVELTNIQESEVQDQGVSFFEAVDAFREFVGDVSIWTFDADYDVFGWNFKKWGIRNPFVPFTRVKSKLSQWNIDPNAYSSGILYQAVGLNMEGHVHNALHDVRSMFGALYELQKRGKQVF